MSEREQKLFDELLEALEWMEALFEAGDFRAEAERLFALASEAYVRSPLPPEPDRKRAERLVVEIVYDYHKLRKHST